MACQVDRIRAALQHKTENHMIDLIRLDPDRSSAARAAMILRSVALRSFSATQNLPNEVRAAETLQSVLLTPAYFVLWDLFFGRS
jgi:hypothetical protein